MALNWNAEDQQEVADSTSSVFGTQTTLLQHIRAVANPLPGQSSVAVRRRLKLTGPVVRLQTPTQAANKEALVFDSIQADSIQVPLSDRMYKNVELLDAEVTFGGDGIEGGESLKTEVGVEQGRALSTGVNNLIVTEFKTSANIALGTNADPYDAAEFAELVLAQAAELATAGVDTSGLRLILGSQFMAKIGTSDAFLRNPTVGADFIANGVVGTYFGLPVLNSLQGIDKTEAYLYHRDAVGFVSRPVASADSMEGAVVNTVDGVAFRSYRSADPRQGTALFVADLYPGAKVLEPEAVVRWTANFGA